MPSSIVRNPSRPDDDFKTQQELEFDRWRTAIKIVQRMREAGIVANYLMMSKTATDATILSSYTAADTLSIVSPG